MQNLILSLLMASILCSCGGNKGEKELLSAEEKLNNKKYTEVVSIITDDFLEKNASAKAFNLRGIAHLNLNEKTLAIQHFLSSVELDSSNYKPFYNLGNVYYQNQDFSKASTYFDKAIKLKDDVADLHLNKGLVCISQQNGAQAKIHFDKVVQLEPDHLLGNYYAGTTDFYFKDYKSAIPKLEQALEIAKKEQNDDLKVNSMLFLAKCHIFNLEGDKDKGCELLREAAETGNPNALNEFQQLCLKDSTKQAN